MNDILDEALVRAFDALGHPMRLALARWALKNYRGTPVGVLASCAGFPTQTHAHQHVLRMEAAGLLTRTRDGTRVLVRPTTLLSSILDGADGSNARA